jgi:hypothetical protein
MTANNWAVIRFDFNGNEVLVEKGLSEERARELAAEFESHGHHQTYWARRVPEAPVDYVQMLRDLRGSGSPLEVAVRVLRNQGGSVEECAAAVREVFGMSWEEARRVVAGCNGS